ncbi:MAG TPA: TIGR04190 family B12-binding domain/radical SAM domain protein [Anaerolineales bacterium]|nr:TIGR04190 family B12-binding domain/radical SAM domain protein [Anaerolineales bacterium]
MHDLILLHAPSVYDFRRRATLWGPISDLVPSEPVFDMYPLGFGTLAAYLGQHGLSVRIVNLAARMVRDRMFNVEIALAEMDARAFGIDLHWLPHAHGALEIARLVKAYHPGRPVIFGGYSASYFYDELIRSPHVDYILRGDSTEAPLLDLMLCILEKGNPEVIPNLVWKRPSGEIRVNPQTYIPDSLDHLTLDYYPIVRSVVRDRNLSDYLPFNHWLDYPIMAAVTARGCRYNCVFCGGSDCASRQISGRTQPAFRSPELLAEDVRRLGALTRAPVFILGDLRQGGREYAARFFRAVQGFEGPVMTEFFYPAGRAYLEMFAAALPNFTVEFSPESHDPKVRSAMGKHYSNAAIEEMIAASLAAGARRFDLFYMIGLSQQTPASVLETVEESRRLLERFPDGRLVPFISPLAPFLDPGSLAYEQPEAHGYLRRAFTLEDHRRRLLEPTWKHILSYETRWMDRDTLAETTYEAGLRLNRVKRSFGLVDRVMAERTEARIRRARGLMAEIDVRLAEGDRQGLERWLLANKREIDRANASTVCDKSELDISVGPIPFKLLNLAGIGLGLTD